MLHTSPPYAVRQETEVAEPKTLVEAAYRSLRRNIIEGRLSPGEKLRIEHEELKKRLNGGEFGKEDARMTNAGNKRDSSQISTGGDIWDEFEQAMLVQNGMQKA